MPRKANIYIGCVLAVAIVVLSVGFLRWECRDLTRYIGCVVLTLLASTFKVRLPGLPGTFSLGFVFILLGVADLSFAEIVVMAGGSAAVQCLWRAKKQPQAIQVLFSVGNLVINTAAAYLAFHFVREHRLAETLIGSLALAASVLYVLNTGLLSIVLALVDGKSVKTMWEHWVVWSFPYYLAGAVVAGTFGLTSRYVDWKSAALITPLLFLIYFCYRRYAETPSAELRRLAPSLEIKAA